MRNTIYLQLIVANLFRDLLWSSPASYTINQRSPHPDPGPYFTMGPVVDPRAPLQRIAAAPSTHAQTLWSTKSLAAAHELHDSHLTQNIMSPASPSWLTRTVEKHFPGIDSPPFLKHSTQLRVKAYASTAWHLLSWAGLEYTTIDFRACKMAARPHELDFEMASILMVEAELAQRTSLSPRYAAPVLNGVHLRIPTAHTTITGANHLCKFSCNSLLKLVNIVTVCL